MFFSSYKSICDTCSVVVSNHVYKMAMYCFNRYSKLHANDFRATCSKVAFGNTKRVIMVILDHR